ncbi:hypothetical protein [Saccharopolyspora sp. NPDC002578]
MSLVPENRTLFAVDVVESASNRGYHTEAIAPAVDGLVDTALHHGGLGAADVLDRESTGDGVLLTLPGSHLGSVLDAAEYLDRAAARRNRLSKPEIRLRIAVDTGPVGVVPGYYPAKTALTRMLDAPAFKELIARCREIGDSDEVNTALIVSDHAKRIAFSGDHLRVLREGEFSRFPVRNKEYAAEAWVRVADFDARSVAAHLATLAAEPEPETGAGTGTVGSHQLPEVSQQFVNTVHGNVQESFQAGVVYGDVHNGRPR